MAAAAVGLMVSLPFLNPVHTYPIPTFYEEALAFALGLLAFACVGFAGGRASIGIPAISVWIAALAAYLLLQPRWMELAYDEPAQLAGLYCLWAAALMVVGAHLRAALGAERFAGLLAGAILLSALLGAGAGLVQALDLDSAFRGVVARRLGHYVFGNLAQRNLHANHLVIGSACLAYLWAAGRIAAVPAVLAGLLLALGIDASGSRASILMLGWLVLWSLWIRRNRIRDLAASRLVAAAAALAVAVVVFGIFAQASPGPFDSATARLLHGNPETGDPSVRLAIYEAALRVWMGAPIAGAGFGGFAWAHYTTATPWTGAVAMNPDSNAHNIVLHFLAETGLAGTAILVLGLWLWFFRVVAREISLPIAWAVAIVGAELVHSLVEYPLWHAQFLGVAAVLAGFADPRPISVKSALAMKGLAAGALLLGGTLLAFTTRSYVQLRFWGLAVPQEMRAQAEVRVQERKAIAEVRRSLLRPYADLGLAHSLNIAKGDLAAQLEFNGRAVRAWPVYPLVRNQIVLLAMAGRDAEALRLLDNLARLQPQHLADLADFLGNLPDTRLPEVAPIRARIATLLGR
jgi:O-antigen ligase